MRWEASPARLQDDGPIPPVQASSNTKCLSLNLKAEVLVKRTPLLKVLTGKSCTKCVKFCYSMLVGLRRSLARIGGVAAECGCSILSRRSKRQAQYQQPQVYILPPTIPYYSYDQS